MTACACKHTCICAYTCTHIFTDIYANCICNLLVYICYKHLHKYTNIFLFRRSKSARNFSLFSASGSFNQSVNSGIVHATGVLIVPFSAPVTGTSGGLGDSHWKSPFDTCPCTTSPVSLSSLQVSVGGQTAVHSTLHLHLPP